jgi:predicted amidohydrolase
MRRRIACAQLEARDLADAPRALDDALGAIEQAGAAGADLCVLPEGTFPGYVLGSVAAGRAALTAGPDARLELAAAARRAGIEVVAGIVLDTPDRLMNAAVHFGPDGAERNRVAKQFLWHFDRAWFTQGDAGEVVDGLGVLVCADGRLPEIAGGLAAHGARLLVNSTAWVVSQPPPAGTNAQAEFLWRVRALENGCAAAAATKVGTEAGVAMYGGKSQIVAADGSVVAMASATDPELLVADVEVPDAPRSPAGRAVERTVPAIERERGRRRPRPGSAHVVAVTDRALLPAIAAHGARLVVGPDGVVACHDLDVTTFSGDDLLVPGPARMAADLDRAEVLVWIATGAATPYVEEVARARALENRVFVVVWRPLAAGGPLIVGPSGAVLARGPEHEEFAVAATVVPAEAAAKEVAPGSDVILGLR